MTCLYRMLQKQRQQEYALTRHHLFIQQLKNHGRTFIAKNRDMSRLQPDTNRSIKLGSRYLH